MKVLNVEKYSKNRVLFNKNDKKILSLLCHNIRLPISKIARILNLSRQSVEYRIKTMEKAHLIAGSRTVINIRKMGYYSYHFFMNVDNGDSEKEFLKRCAEDENVNVLISYSGKLGYELSIMAKSPEEAQTTLSSLTDGLEIGDCFPCILLKTIKASILPGYVTDKIPRIKNIKNDPSFSKQFQLEKKNYKLDEKDKMILFMLSQNAQENISTIGRNVGLTKDAVSYRIKNLIRSKYIIQFRPVIDYSVLNLNIQAILIKTKNRNNSVDERFSESLKNNNSVLWATNILGDWDYLVYVMNQNQEEIHNLVKELRDSFGNYIHNYEILFAYQEHKYSFMTKSMGKP